MIHLVTFATDDMGRSAWQCAQSSKAHGVETHARYNPANTSRFPEVKEHRDLFEQPRGAGYWAWKPLIIQQELGWLPEGAICIYSDAGVEFIDNVRYIIDRMDQDVFLFGNMFDHAHWCKRDIIEAIWLDPIDRWKAQSWERFGKQVQASVIFFRVSDYSRRFVKEWVDWCLFEGGRLIDDSPSRTPNHPEFQENRHDQAILTTLAYREGIRLHWWPAVYNRFEKGGPIFTYDRGEYPNEGYPPLFHHHRWRDWQWEQAA